MTEYSWREDFLTEEYVLAINGKETDRISKRTVMNLMDAGAPLKRREVEMAENGSSIDKAIEVVVSYVFILAILSVVVVSGSIAVGCIFGAGWGWGLFSLAFLVLSTPFLIGIRRAMRKSIKGE